jgi:MFS family permease
MQTADSRTRRRPFLTLMAANAVSQIGNMMTVVAVPWFVLETTGSATQVGLVSAAVALGAVLPAILGGPLVDRVGLRRASVVADVLSSATVLLIPLLYLAGALEFWALVLLAFVLSSVNSEGDAGRMALLPALAARAQIAPERANAVDRAVARSGQLVGPVVAGILIAFIGPTNVLFIDAVTFGLSALLIALGIGSMPHPAAVDDASPGYASELAEGLHFVARNRLILSMVLLATVGNFLDVPLLTVVLPVYASTIFDSPTSLGLMLGSFAGGALLGTLAFGFIGRRLPRRATFLTSWLLASVVVYGALALQVPLPLVVVAGLLGGLVGGPINPILLTVVQAETPERLRGRVFGTINALSQAGIPFGAAAIGLLIEGAGLIETITGMGLLYVLTIGLMFAIPALRRMERAGQAEPMAEMAQAAYAEPPPQARRCATMKAGL